MEYLKPGDPLSPPAATNFCDQFAGLRLLTQHFPFHCHCRRRRPAEEFSRLEHKIQKRVLLQRTDLVSLCSANRSVNDGRTALLSSSNDAAKKKEKAVAEKWRCGFCKVVANSEKQWKQHVEGSKHKKMNPKSLRKQEKKPAEAKKKGWESAAGFEFWCEACQVGTYALDGMIKHIGGKRHGGRMKELDAGQSAAAPDDQRSSVRT